MSASNETTLTTIQAAFSADLQKNWGWFWPWAWYPSS